MLKFLHIKHSFFFISIIYWGLMMTNFGLPGPYMDEFLDFSYIPGILNSEKLNLYHYRLPDNPLFPNLPILGGKIYAQIIIPYLSIPFFLLAGFSLASERLFLALFGYLMTYFCFNFCNKNIGNFFTLILFLFLLLNPNFSFFLRSTYYIFYFSIFLSVVSLYFFKEFLDQKKNIYIFFSGFFLTLSFNNFFIFFITSSIIGLIYLKYLNFDIRKIVLIVLGALCAFLPIIYSLISIKVLWPEFISLSNNWGIPSYASNKIDTFSFLNLSRIKNFIFDLSCDFSIISRMTGEFNVVDKNFRLYLFILIIFYSLFKLIFNVFNKRQQLIQLFLSCSILLFVIFSFILQGVNQSHFFLFEFLIYLQIFFIFYESKFFSKIAAIFIILITLSNINVLFKSHSILNKTEGVNLFSSKMSYPSNYQKGFLYDHHPIFYSWGFFTSFVFLTNGEVNYSVLQEPKKIQTKLDEYKKISIYVVENEFQKSMEGLKNLNGDITNIIEIKQFDKNNIFRIILIEKNE